MFFLFIGQYNYNQPPKSSEEPTCRKSMLPQDTLFDFGGFFICLPMVGREGAY